MPRVLIVIPTYNEAENVERIVGTIHGQVPDADVLIVDDGSPDGTGRIVARMKESDPRIHLIERPGKLGLGTAYVAGFKFALTRGYDLVFEMDADFSHDPAEIPAFMHAAEDADLVIGSRYLNGVRVLNWPIQRLLLSYFANVYTRMMTGLPLTDATGGFKCYRLQVLASVNLEEIRSNGYAFQIEMSYKVWKKGFRLKEIPIIFLDRRSGSSKMSKQIVHEAFFMLWKLPLQTMLGKR